MGTIRAIVFAVLALFAPHMGMAQMATLLADSVSIQGNNTIVASGNVEILVDGARLQASQIIFNNDEKSLIIEGPIVLHQGTETLFLASSAELDADLRNGIFRSARMVLSQQLQLAAAQISRVDGRYTQLDNTVASSCRICADSPVPLWQIRASKVIHDQVERQLYFENAQLRIGNVPVFFIPRLRLPDPTLKRATGFLIPTLHTSTRLGVGFKIPYFIVFGDHADLTVTPFFTNQTNTFEARYRQAFAHGRLQFDTALTNDRLSPGQVRTYLFGQGDFDLARGFELKFDFEQTSDPAYLLEYGYSEKDRLDSEVSITRTRAFDHFNAGLINFKTLRGSELAIEDQLPNFQGELHYERRFFPARLGGQGSWSLGLEGHVRDSNLNELGRDVAHASGRLKWARTTQFSNGMLGRIGTELAADIYLIGQDSNYSPTLAFFTPALEAELRWPLIKTGRNGATMVLEPVIHLAWTTNLGADVPNEDSTIVEFDEGNLFSISRFPGDDRFESGARATLGLKWTRFDPRGWSLSLAMGQVLRDGDTGQFTSASGLDGARSDWLLAGQYKNNDRLSVTARALFHDALDVTKAETQISWHSQKLNLATTYSWVVPDAQENRPDLTSQMTLDADYNFQRHWNTSLKYLYDFAANKGTKAVVGLQYINECISVDLSLSRRFTSSTSVTPSTDIGLSVNLLGFGSGTNGVQRSCSG